MKPKRSARAEIDEALADGKITCRSCPTVVLQPGTFCRECQMYWDDVDAGLFDDPVEEWYGYDDDDEG